MSNIIETFSYSHLGLETIESPKGANPQALLYHYDSSHTFASNLRSVDPFSYFIRSARQVAHSIWLRISCFVCWMSSPDPLRLSLFHRRGRVDASFSCNIRLPSMRKVAKWLVKFFIYLGGDEECSFLADSQRLISHSVVHFPLLAGVGRLQRVLSNMRLEWLGSKELALLNQFRRIELKSMPIDCDVYRC
jgi:hypothetical protein